MTEIRDCLLKAREHAQRGQDLKGDYAELFATADEAIRKAWVEIHGPSDDGEEDAS